MPRELILPATVMSLAFVFYTTGVWSERIQRDLRGWHVVLFSGTAGFCHVRKTIGDFSAPEKS